MTLRISVFMPRGAEGLKWGPCTSISKKTQIITNSSERFQRRQAPARRFGRRSSIAFTSPLHQMTKKKQQSWFSSRSREKSESLEENMKAGSAILSLLALVPIAFLAACRSAPAADTASATRHELAPLQLIQRIPVPGVTGRIDHFTAYPKRRLLIFAALGNNSLDIVNTFEGKVVQSIKGLNEPQGVVYVPEFDKIFVANAGNGTVNVYDGKTYALRKSVALGEESDTDNLR